MSASSVYRDYCDWCAANGLPLVQPARPLFGHGGGNGDGRRRVAITDGHELRDSIRRRHDPDRALPEYRELRMVRVAAWPAGPRSWKLRRAIGRAIEHFAAGIGRVAAAVSAAGDFVHGQPIVDERLRDDWSIDIAKREAIQVGFPEHDPRRIKFASMIHRRFPEAYADRPGMLAAIHRYRALGGK